MFTANDIATVERWFDDDETRRRLGGREWPRQLLELVRTPPSGTLERIAWLALDDEEQVGLVDVEIYPDRTASLALVVDPERCCRGHGRAILELVCRALSGRVRELRGGIETGNEASRRCALAADFAPVASEPDADGFIDYVRVLDREGA
ncbi:MAG TPA: GNAT family N-acetyltransferase [Candidatus Limnocylindria bacterium]|nr:GNAT family N-acetyltransferase [Candidatus Limnocylindria bacterium]